MRTHKTQSRAGTIDENLSDAISLDGQESDLIEIDFHRLGNAEAALGNHDAAPPRFNGFPQGGSVIGLAVAASAVVAHVCHRFLIGRECERIASVDEQK